MKGRLQGELRFPGRNERGQGLGEGHLTGDTQASLKQLGPPLPSRLLPQSEEREKASLSNVVQTAAPPGLDRLRTVPKGAIKTVGHHVMAQARTLVRLQCT